jgi:AcrR family transcriptional regulator
MMAWEQGEMSDGRKRRREDPAVRRAQIVEAAKRSFRTFGLQATTVDQIAAEAGVSVGLLYRFFKSKASIVEAIIVEDVELQLEQTALALEEASSDLGRLPQLIAQRLAEGSVERERLALMFEIAAEVCRNRDLQAFVREKRVELRDRLAANFEAKGLDRRATYRLIERLDATSAVASGLAMHAMIYSDSSQLSHEIVEKLMAAAVMAAEDERSERGAPPGR